MASASGAGARAGSGLASIATSHVVRRISKSRSGRSMNLRETLEDLAPALAALVVSVVIHEMMNRRRRAESLTSERPYA